MFGCHLLEPVLVRRVKLIPAEREKGEEEEGGQGKGGEDKEGGGGTCDPYIQMYT